MTAPAKPAQNRPNCTGCRHYYITWEPSHPYGCRAYGFKSRRVPGAVVIESSGKECILFKPAKRKT